MKEFEINNYLTLKLEGKKTIVYVNDVRFMQCKYILLHFSNQEDMNLVNEISSIDEAAEKLNRSLESGKHLSSQISSKTEFWAHCSNLQAWAEHGYDTRLLHSNLSFPLLKALTKAGDPQAKKVFKEEIAKRFLDGGKTVKTYLIKQGYLDFLNKEELETLIYSKETSLEKYEESDSIDLEDLGYLYNKLGEERKAIKYYKKYLEKNSHNFEEWYHLALIYKNLSQYDKSIDCLIKSMNLNDKYIDLWRFLIDLIDEPYFISLLIQKFPEDLKIEYLDRLIEKNNRNPREPIIHLVEKELVTLNISHVRFNNQIFRVKDNELKITNQNITELSQIEGLPNLSQLKTLNLNNNKISKIDDLQNLELLEELVLNFNQILEITGVSKLEKLKKLELKSNLLSEVKGINSLKSLEYLNLPNNHIKTISDLKGLNNLKQLVLSHNKIRVLENLSELKSLEELYISDNPLSEIKDLSSLKNLRILNIARTKIKEIPRSLTNCVNLEKIIATGAPLKDYPKEIEGRISRLKKRKGN